MRLLINTATTFKGGGLQVAKSFIEECRNFSEHDYHVILSVNLSKLLALNSFDDNFYFYSINYRPATRIFSLKRADEFMKFIADKVQPDVVFTTSGPAYWRPVVPHLLGYNLAHYLYPESIFFNLISFWQKIEFFLRGKLILHYYRRDGDAYVVQTDAVNMRLQKKLGRKNVYTVSNTCSTLFFQPYRDIKKLPQVKKGEIRLLLLSAYYIHKGFDILPHVIAELKRRGVSYIKFVLTLPQADFEEKFPDQSRSYIYNVGPVNVEECPSLYNECDALFLPTLLECFSVSYVEAMAMGKPIITSDLDFAHIVCADAAIYFNPRDVIDIVDKILSLNTILQQNLVKKGKKRLKTFNNAKQRAEEYLNLCAKLINERK